VTGRRLRVGLISDTHGLWRPAIPGLFAAVDLIVHAGDVGDRSILTELGRIAPVEAVFGNVDDVHDPQLAAHRTVPVGSLTLHVSHGHELGSPTPARLAERYAADVIVFGHTHRAVVATVQQGARSTLVINPGAAGPRRFDLRPSVAILTVDGRRAGAEVFGLE
jgi:putative phosphoesterase